MSSPRPPAAAGSAGWDRFVRDLKGGGKKTVLLAGLSAVGAYLYLPKVWGLVGGAPDVPPPPVSAFADPPAAAGAAAEPAAPAEPGGAALMRGDVLDPGAVLDRLAADVHLRPAGPGEVLRDPFTPVAGAAFVYDGGADEPPAESESEPAAVAAAPPSDEDVARWLPVSATLAGPGGAAAVLAGRPVAVGEVVEGGGRRFAVAAVRPGAVEVRLLDPPHPVYLLTLPEPDGTGPVRVSRRGSAPRTAAATRNGGTDR